MLPQLFLLVHLDCKLGKVKKLGGVELPMERKQGGSLRRIMPHVEAGPMMGLRARQGSRVRGACGFSLEAGEGLDHRSAPKSNCPLPRELNRGFR